MLIFQKGMSIERISIRIKGRFYIFEDSWTIYPQQ